MTGEPVEVERCGECDSRMMKVGRFLRFCTKPACSMYERAVDIRYEHLLPLTSEEIRAITHPTADVVAVEEEAL